MTICSFDIPISIQKRYIVYLIKRCNKWKSLISQTFTQEKIQQKTWFFIICTYQNMYNKKTCPLNFSTCHWQNWYPLFFVCKIVTNYSWINTQVSREKNSNPVDTGCKLNVSCTFNLRPVPTGKLKVNPMSPVTEKKSTLSIQGSSPNFAVVLRETKRIN